MRTRDIRRGAIADADSAHRAGPACPVRHRQWRPDVATTLGKNLMAEHRRLDSDQAGADIEADIGRPDVAVVVAARGYGQHGGA